MAWIREDDVFEPVEAVGAKDDFFCNLGVRERAVLSVEHDAAVRVIHQLQELANQDGVDIRLTPSSVGSYPSTLGILEKLLSICTDDTWDENCHVNLEIVPRITVWSTEGNEHPLLKRFFGSGIDRLKEVIVNRQRDTGSKAKSEVTHEEPPN